MGGGCTGHLRGVGGDGVQVVMVTYHLLGKCRQRWHEHRANAQGGLVLGPRWSWWFLRVGEVGLSPGATRGL